jgi:two-component system chemotaxis sensor kinase CheA
VEPGPFFGPFLDDYFAECEEHLANLRHLLLEMEETDVPRPLAEERVRGIFRILHTLKGLSGMVGFAESEEVAHALEEWLRGAAPGGYLPSHVSPDVLFEGAGLLERCLAARRDGVQPPDVSEFVAVRCAAPRPAEERGAAVGPAAEPGAAAVAGLKLSAAESLHLEAALRRGDRLEEFEFIPTPELVGRGMGVEAVRVLLGSLGEIVHASPRVLPGRGVAFRFLLALPPDTEIPGAWRDDGLSWTPAAPSLPSIPGTGAVAVAPGADRGGGAATGSANVVRVDLARLDELLRLVGELVISRSRLADLLDGTPAGRGVAVDALEEINAAMERQLRGLREGVMRVRLVAVGEAFERMRFVVREVANGAGKDVRVELVGQSTEIDKLVVERMMEPLLHLVRNAVSHGIGTPAERIERGKPPQGLLRLSASAAGERVRIVVEDDGRGIDRAAVAERARAQGLPVPDEPLDDADLLAILCTPGFSTREVADLASGRGIGMDVVRSTVRALGGELSLSSEPGRGTRATVELPLTLMIVDALLVRVGGQTMAVPQPALLEVLQVDRGEVVTFENNEVLRYRGRVLPLLRLRRLFRESDGAHASFPVLVVGTEAQPLGLVVDGLAGLREIVVRSLGDPLVAVPGIAAAAELGDGRVCLILDSAELVQLAQGERERTQPARPSFSPATARNR